MSTTSDWPSGTLCRFTFYISSLNWGQFPSPGKTESLHPSACETLTAPGPSFRGDTACNCLQPSGTEHSWLLQPQPLALSHLLQHHRSTQASRHLPRLCTTSKPFCQPSACPQQGVMSHSHGLLQDLVQELRTAFISASSCHLCQAFSVLHLAFVFPFCLGSSYKPVAMEIPNCKPLLGLSSPRNQPLKASSLWNAQPVLVVSPAGPGCMMGTSLAALQSSPLGLSWVWIGPSAAARQTPQHEHVTDHHTIHHSKLLVIYAYRMAAT